MNDGTTAKRNLLTRGWRRLDWRRGRSWREIRAVVIATLMIAGVTTIAQPAAPASAAGGAYTLNFAAADPSIYLPPIPFPGDFVADPVPGGRGDGSPLIPLADFNDGTSDVRVESLAPQDMALGQVVPFETRISVSGDVTPENGVITFLIGWNTLTTNGGDFGYDARVDDIGYGVIEAFIDTSDGAHVDPGADAQVDSFSWSIVNDEIVGVFTVSGLDNGDVVVLEPWLVLDDTIPAGIGGNVQSRLIDAVTGSDQSFTVANSGSISLDNGDAISTGNQTVPLLKPSDFFTVDVDVSVTKTDDIDPIDLNGTLTYTITATNAGPSVANSVVVYDQLDPNVTFVSASDGGFVNTDTGDTVPDGAIQWNVGALAPGDSVQYTLMVTVNSDAPTQIPNGEDLVNTVTVTTISADTNLENNVDTEPTDVNFPAAPELTLVKTASPSTYDTVGQSISYSYDVSNSGNVSLAGPVTVADDKASVTCPAVTSVGNNDGNLDPGESITCSASYTITQADLNSGSVTNVATASADGTDSNEDQETVTANQTPAIVADKVLHANVDEDGSGDVSVNDTLTYRITATNGGNVTLTNVTVDDDLTGTTDAPCAASLAPGASCFVDVTYVVTQADVDAGQIVNLGAVEGTPPVGDPVTDDDPEVVPVPQDPALAVVKALTGNADEDGSTTVSLGDTLEYTITATNTGNVTLNNVTVSDDLTGDSTACGLVTPDGTCVLVVNYVVTQADVDAGVINNIGTADSDETDPVDDPEVVPVPQDPALAVVKALTGNADEDGSTTVSLGDTLEYTITATNTGNVTLNNVTVSDDLTGDSTACGLVTPDGTCVLVVNYVVTQADVDAGVINNIGTADSDETDPVDDPEVVPVPQDPALAVVKALTGNADEDGSTTVSLGDTLEYTITATNTGNVTLNNVTVSDDLTGDSTACGLVTPDGTCVLVVNYVVTQADVDAGVINNIGTADSDETDPVDDPEVVPVPQDPALAVVKALTGNADEDGSTTVSLDDTLTYTVTATNTGNVTLNNVVVSDNLTSPGITVCPSVAPGGTCVLVGTYQVTQDDVDAGEILNLGVANSNETPPVDDPEVVPVPQNPSIDLVKSGSFNDESGDGLADAGETISYSFTVTNDGNVTLTNVVVSDPLISDIDCGDGTANIGTMAPSTVGVTCTGSYALTQPDVDAGFVVNTALATGTDPNGNSTTDVDSHTEPLPQAASIVADKAIVANADEDVSGTVSLGDTLTYEITATNDGNVTLTNVTVDDDLTGTTDAPCAASLAPGASCSVLVDYVVTQADVDTGVIDNTGTVEGTPPSGGPVTDSDDESVPVPQNPALAVDKTLTGNDDPDGSGDVSVGDTLTYTITATNAGDVTLTNVSVTDDLTGDSTSCASVAPGDTCVLVVNYVVMQPDVDAGQITNIGEADSDQTPPVEDPEVVPVPQNPAIEILKSSSLDLGADGIATPGDVISYSFTVTNIGDVTLSDVTVNDAQAGVSDCVIGTMAPLAVDTSSCSGSYAITQADIDNGSVYNQAFVAGEAPDGDPGNPEDDVTDDDDNTQPIAEGPALAVDKVLTGNADEDGSDDVSEGDTLEYTITALNTGNVTLNSVVVSDDLTGDSTNCAEVAPGGTCVLVTNYVVTAADIAAGQIVNTGTADSDETPPVDDPNTETVPQPGLEVDKALTGNDDADGSNTVSLGDTLSYSITATNTGTANLTNVVVDDSLTGDSAACAIVLPGDSCMLLVTYVVQQSDVDAGQVVNVGTADSDQTPPDEDPNTEPVPQNPAIVADKVLHDNADEDLSGDVSRGDTLTYRITATNSGNVTLTNVTVDDALTGTADAPCAASLAPGASCFVDVTYVVTQPDVDAGQIDNIGAVEGTPPVGDPVTDDDPETVDVPQNPSIEIVKTFTGYMDVEADGEVSLNDVLEYDLVAENTGNVSLTNVLVSDSLTGASIGCASLAPGDTCVLSTMYTVTQVDVDNGAVLNTGVADSDQTPPDEDDEIVPVPQHPAIAADKVLQSNADEDLSGDVSLNDTLTYRITATNSGNVTLTNVTIDDDLTGTTDALCAASLAPGASCFLDVAYVVTQADVDAGQIDNLGVVEGTPPIGDPVTDDDPETVEVPQNPSIDADKIVTGNADEDLSGDVSLGDTLTFTITATNDGDVTLTNVTVDDDLTGTTDAPCAASLAPGESCSVDVMYVVAQADVDEGKVENTGTVEGTPPIGPPVTDSDPEEVPVPQNPSILADKVLLDNADEDMNGEVSLDDTLTYRITATNDGNVTLIEVTVQDLMTGTIGAPCAASLAPGESCFVDVTYVVTQADVDAGQIDNLGEVEGTDPNSDPVADDDPETVDVPQNPAIQIVKSSTLDLGGDGIATPGDVISYTFEVTNTGNVTLSNVTVNDAEAGVVGCVIGTMAPGAVDSTTCSGTYAITQADINVGQVDNQAFVTGDDPKGDPTGDDDTDTEDIPQHPELSIDKTVVSVTNPDASDGGASVDQAGDTITYSIVVENTGNVTLTGVAIADPLLADLLCPPSDILNPGDSFTCVGTYTVTQGDIDGNGGGDGDIDNTATADSDQTDQVDDSEAVPVVQDPDITAVKILLSNADEDGSGDVSLGDTLTYRITAFNTGNVTLTNVTVDDDLTGTTDALCATTLPVGLSCDVAVTYMVTQTDVDAGVIENIGTVEGTDPNGDPVNDSDPEEVDVPQFPAISLAKDFAGAEQETVTAGTGSSFVLVVTNTGNVTLSDALIEDVVDGRLEVTSVSATGGADSDTDGNAQTVEWLIPTLAVGDSVTITVNFAVDSSVQPATIDNVAAVAAEGPLGDPGDPADDATDTGQDDIDVVTSADLSITKADGVTQVTAGDGVTYVYTITVDNAGPSDADNVTVTEDSFPAGFDMGAVSCTLPCNLGTIAAGGSASFTVEYTVPSSTQAGFETNTVSVTSDEPDPNPENDSDDDTNEVLTSADLSISKDDGVAEVTAGDGVTYTYTITVDNAGPSDADNVTVTEDSFPAGFDMGAVSCTLPCNLGTIAAGGSASFTVEYTVPSSTQAGFETNTVSVTSDEPDPNPENDSDDDTNEVLTSADLSISKDDGVIEVTAGDGVTYTYTITVNNAGPSNADDVTVADTWPAGFSQGAVTPSQGTCDNAGGDFGCDLGTIAAGGSATITVAYTVPSSTQAGDYTNSVTVTSSDPDPTPGNNSDDDTNEVLTESDLSIVKDDGVTQVIAGDGVTYTYTITVDNAGPSDADNVTVTEDSFPAGFDMGAVASSQGGCAAFPCNLGTIATGGSATITVDYTVPSDTAAGFETNTVSVTSDEPDPNPENDTDSDTNEVLTDINLSIVKTFDPTSVPQGTLQSFTIEVSNAGPSDALIVNGTQVSVTDVVNTSLEVQAVTVTSGSGSCAAPSQNIDCTVEIPAGGSVTITVDYLVAPFLDEDPLFGGTGGDEFRFVFVNGAILEGSTATGEIYLDGVDVSDNATFVSSVTRNDIIVDLDGAGPDPAFEMHLSCSDPFTGGWGQSAGPVEGVDVNWQIAFFSIARYNNNGFIKNCGNVVNDFDVPNTATATGTDSFGTDVVSDDATVTVGPGITLDKLTTKGKRLTVRLTNLTGDDKVIVDVSAVWPAGNGNLTKTWLTQDGTSTVFWSGVDDPTDAFLDGTDPGWNGATLLTGEGIMRFDFANKVAKTGYTIRVNFSDGTFLDISK